MGRRVVRAEGTGSEELPGVSLGRRQYQGAGGKRSQGRTHGKTPRAPRSECHCLPEAGLNGAFNSPHRSEVAASPAWIGTFLGTIVEPNSHPRIVVPVEW